MPDRLKSELLFTFAADLAEAQQIGAAPLGHRLVIPVTGGHFEGPKLRGELLPGGGDWLLSRSDGVNVLDVRATLRTDDGHLIYTSYTGRAHGQPGTPEHYFRTTPYFETGSEKYAWLNRIVAVGVGTVTATGVEYTVYEIL